MIGVCCLGSHGVSGLSGLGGGVGGAFVGATQLDGGVSNDLVGVLSP